MIYKELAILLPCHSLEDFPTHHTGDDAASLLASWTGLWHPLLIANSGSIIKWHRADDPPETLLDVLLIVPTVAADNLATGYLQRARDAGATVIESQTCREEVISTALADGEFPEINSDIIADFLALGYYYLQIELLTRQMRYASNLDEIHFENLCCEAARFAVEQDDVAAVEKLQAAFDLLSSERDHYYSVDAYLIDITMITSTTMGDMLNTDIASQVPSNLLLAPELLEQLFTENPNGGQRIVERVTDASLTVMGCEYGNPDNMLIPAESVLATLLQGQQEYEKYLKIKPTIYGRRQFGLTPNHPQWLSRLGYRAALHVLLDSGTYPEGQQAKARWEGVDGSSVDAIARVPLNANKHETFLTLAAKLGETMDMDHVATLCLAHWPSATTPWYGDIKRAAKYTNALGKFVTLTEYFTETDLPGVSERFTADQYRSPSLEQAMSGGQADPISSVVAQWKSHNSSDVLNNVALLNELLDNDSSAADLAAEIGAVTQHSVDSFAHGLQRGDGSEPGLLVMNPSSHVRRVDMQDLQLDAFPKLAAPVYAAGPGSGNGAHVIVDVPAMGFTWVATNGSKSTTGQEMAAERMLRNDFFEVLINETTGGIQSINSHADPRHGRGSLQLAYRQAVRKKSGRLAEPDDLANYSVMAADSIKITAATPTRGEITTSGRLMHRSGEILATFEQVYSVERGSRILGIKTELDIRQEPVNKPWNSYYCLRYAWGDEAANLTRGLQGTSHGASSKRLVAPEYIEIDSDKKTTLLTGGLPYHRRVGRRFLDSILVVSGETCRSFQVGIGIDLDQPQIVSQQFQQSPMYAIDFEGEPSGHNSSSLLHLGARNLIATHWQTVLEGETVVGLQARIMETTGRSVRTKLTTFRPVVSAVQQNLDGSLLGECNVEDGQVVLDMTGHEWLQVELRF